MLGRDGIEPSTSGLKVQASHQQARPTPCRHNDLLVRGRAAWWRFEAASVPKLCQINRPGLLNWGSPDCDSRPSLLFRGDYLTLCLQEGKSTSFLEGSYDACSARHHRIS